MDIKNYVSTIVDSKVQDSSSTSHVRKFKTWASENDINPQVIDAVVAFIKYYYAHYDVLEDSGQNYMRFEYKGYTFEYQWYKDDFSDLFIAIAPTIYFSVRREYLSDVEKLFMVSKLATVPAAKHKSIVPLFVNCSSVAHPDKIRYKDKLFEESNFSYDSWFRKQGIPENIGIIVSRFIQTIQESEVFNWDDSDICLGGYFTLKFEDYLITQRDTDDSSRPNFAQYAEIKKGDKILYSYQQILGPLDFGAEDPIKAFKHKEGIKVPTKLW